jgi:hypothetical protein
MTKLMRSGGEETAFPIGSPEHPDAAGIVLRGEAAQSVKRFAEDPEKPARCRVGAEFVCERPATMEVYGLAMCVEHGEEAAAGALSEIAFDLEEELHRPMNKHVRPVSPHLAHALRHGFETVPEGSDDAHEEEALLEAFPLERSRADSDILAYVSSPDDEREPPFDSFMGDRMLIHRHMRLAFEEGADWLVETLEAERAQIAAQAAYALALEREAGLR